MEGALHTCTLGRLEHDTAEVRSGFVRKIQLLQDVNEKKVLNRLRVKRSSLIPSRLIQVD